MNEMVERVARALWVGEAGPNEMAFCRKKARAAIEAMREPTDAMITAMRDISYDLVEQGRIWDEYDSDPAMLAHDAPDKAWRTMIDAALA